LFVLLPRPLVTLPSMKERNLCGSILFNWTFIQWNHGTWDW